MKLYRSILVSCAGMQKVASMVALGACIALVSACGSSGTAGAGSGASTGVSAGASAGTAASTGAGTSSGTTASTGVSAGASTGAIGSAGGSSGIASTGATASTGTTAGAGSGASTGVSSGIASTGAGTGASSGIASSGASSGTIPTADAGLTVLDAKSLVCTQVMGVSITYDWFTSGFDMAPLDTTRWQLKGVDVAGISFIDEWSDPNSTLWASNVVSPCAASSNNPDRIIFVGVNWTYTTAAEWVSAYGTLLKTLKGKYSNLKRLDLMTMLRAPKNMLCPGNNSVETVVAPFIDQAIQTFVASNPTFVAAAPAFYVPDCSVFQPNSPHLVQASAPAVAKVLRDYYSTEP